MDDELEKLLDKPILEQMYEFRKESFQQRVYDNCQEIKDIESNVYDFEEKFTKFLKRVIKDKNNYNKAMEKLRNYELEFSKQMDFWSCAYFKLGMIEREKIRNEFFEKNLNLDEKDTYIDSQNDLSEYIEEQKRKYTFDTKEYKELNQRYRSIAEKYPKAVETFEDLKPNELTKDEMKALCELREIDIEMGSLEKKLCFKLGMKEIINL